MVRLGTGFHLILFTLVLPQGAHGFQAHLQTPPIQTPRVDTVFHAGPSLIHDPYLWLENSTTEAVVEWARAQDAYTRYVLGGARRRAKIDSIVAAHPAQRGQLGAPHERNGVWFYARVPPGGTRQLVRSTGPGGTERVLPIDGVVARAWSSAMIWPDLMGERVVAGMGVSGGSTRHLTLAIVDGETGEELAPRIEGVTSQSRVHWLSDGSGFVYSARAAQDTTASGPLQLFVYDVESATSRVVYAHPQAPIGLTFWTVLNREGDAVSFIESGLPTPRLIRVPLSGSAEPEVLLENSTNAYPIGESGGRVFVVSTDNAPMGEVLGFHVGGSGRVSPVVLEDPSGNIVRGRFFGGKLVLQVYSNGQTGIKIIDPEAGTTRTVDLPYIGWMSGDLVGSAWSSSFGFLLEGVVDPGSVYAADVESGQTRRFAGLDPQLNPDDYVTRSEVYESFDGEEVPIFLSYHKDSPPSATTPVWLYAYGSGGFPDAPWYQVQHRAFLDAGGLYAMPGVRGGGAKGLEWQRAGEGRNKQVGISDYVAAAEWLVAEGLADPGRIVANGNSAGGPLVTSAALQRPELFAALLADFSNLDIIRSIPPGSGPRTTWGDPDDPEELAIIMEWAPYSLAQKEGCYPPTFVGQGDQDAMGVFHSYKFVAALQRSQRCDNPVLLQVAWGFGHTLGRDPEKANQLAFLQQVLGLTY